MRWFWEIKVYIESTVAELTSTDPVEVAESSLDFAKPLAMLKAPISGTLQYIEELTKLAGGGLAELFRLTTAAVNQHIEECIAKGSEQATMTSRVAGNASVDCVE